MAGATLLCWENGCEVYSSSLLATSKTQAPGSILVFRSCYRFRCHFARQNIAPPAQIPYKPSHESVGAIEQLEPLEVASRHALVGAPPIVISLITSLPSLVDRRQFGVREFAR
jgi:hypothetical protein